MKMRKWLCLLVCCFMLFAVLAACDNGNGGSSDTGQTPDTGNEGQETPPDTPPAAPKAIYVLDFADGKSDFLAINTGTPMTDKDAGFVVADLDGEKALKMTAPNGGNIRLGINVSGLLGAAAADVRNIVFEIYAGYPDGNFSAVSGRITAMTGDTTVFADATWQIYLASRNPNSATMQLTGDYLFDAAGPNFIEFACTTNGPADRGETPADIYIKSITFFDGNNEALEINTSAGWAQPDGWGDEVILGGWILPNPPPQGDPGGWQTWYTPGVDGNDDDHHMPWEVVAASFGIIFEMEQPESFEFVYMGKFNNWNWTQVNVVDYWADGELMILWDDIGFDVSLINDEDDEVKLAMGNWNQVPVGRIYLMYDEDAVELG